MSRSCTTCQHLKRPDIDRRLAAGEPAAQVARAYELNPSSLHRHQRNCLKLGSSQAIKREAARGSAAMALLPGREMVAGHYLELCQRIDQIVQQAERQGSLSVALNGLNSVKRTLDSLVRLAGHDRPPTGDADATSHGGASLDVAQIAARLTIEFDGEPAIRARIAKALADFDDERTAAAAASAVAPANPVAAHASAAAGLGSAPAASALPTPAAAATASAAVQSNPTAAAATPSVINRGASPVTVVASAIATPTPVRTATAATNVMGVTGAMP
jgi:hypothetical protein